MFIICWKLLFLCKSWLILSALILLLFNYLNLIYTFLLRCCSDLAQISCSNLFVLLTFVDLRIFLLRFCSDLTQISCSDLAQILLKYLAQILLRSCLNLFALSTFVDLRIFLLKYFAQILLKSICSVNTCWLENFLTQIFCSNIWLRSCSNILLRSYSDLAQILLRFICSINTCWLENFLAQIWVEQNIWVRSIFCFLYFASCIMLHTHAVIILICVFCSESLVIIVLSVLTVSCRL